LLAKNPEFLALIKKEGGSSGGGTLTAEALKELLKDSSVLSTLVSLLKTDASFIELFKSLITNNSVLLLALIKELIKDPNFIASLINELRNSASFAELIKSIVGSASITEIAAALLKDTAFIAELMNKLTTIDTDKQQITLDPDTGLFTITYKG
jgi:molybdenum-dependent DNA-binding transcriptional regulator ModE